MCAGSRYTNRTINPLGLTDASCGWYSVNTTLTQDCLQAILLLREAGHSPCTVPNGMVGTGGYRVYLEGTSFGALSIVGTCQVVLGGLANTTLPCEQVAEYAGNLAKICSTGAGTTSGWFFPDSFKDANSTVIVVSS